MSNFEPIYKLVDAHELAAHRFVAEMKHATQKLLYDQDEIRQLLNNQDSAHTRFLHAMQMLVVTLKVEERQALKVELKRLRARIVEVHELWHRAIKSVDVRPVLPA